MLDRLLILILIIIANGMNASTFAEELATQRNIEKTKQSPEYIDLDKLKSKESRKLIYNPRLPEMTQMLQPIPPISSVTSITPQIPENSPPLVKTESNSKSNDQNLSKDAAAKQCNRDIIHNSKKVYEGSQKELNSIISYVGFGILIAIFYMGANFRINNRKWVNLSLGFSIASILLNFLACLYLYQTSENLLKEAQEAVHNQKYSEMGKFANWLFWFLVGTLLIAAGAFIKLGYKFIYDPNTTNNNST